ncbi:hemagglutinin repeat-containing protein, partial [Xanthomonas oryzae pv. oryzicola]
MKNTGTIAGRQLVSIDAGRIEHLGGSISGNQVGLRSASDIRIEGASVTAVDALSVQAVGDVTVASTVETLSGGGYHQYSTTQLQRVAGLYVTGANGSGVLSVMGGGDVTLQAAQIQNAGSDGVTQLVAGNNLTLGAQTLSHSTDTTANDRNFQRSSETTHAVSSVQGAGNVVLAAGNDLTLTAAQVGAGKGLALQAGRDIVSQAAIDSSSSDRSSVTRSHSLAASSTDETVRGTQLGAGTNIVLQAGRDLTLAATAVASQSGGIALAAGHDIQLLATQEQHDAVVDQQTRKKSALSSKTVTTHDESHDSLAVTTSLSGDTVHIAAGNDLRSQGAQIVGTGDVVLAAGNNLTLETAQSTHSEAAQDSFEQHSTSKSSSAAIGVAVTYGADGFAAGVTVSASGARGKADGQDITQRNSHLSAGNTATLISGNDTTLKGAVLSANTVLADIGGDLNVESLQDTSTYTSKDKAVGGSVTFGMGFSASGSYSSNKVNGDFASVKEQSGIQAGDGGFDIRVHGNTDLKGAVIASTQAAVDAGANRLQTGTLTVSDITNTNNYKATGISLSGG